MASVFIWLGGLYGLFLGFFTQCTETTKRGSVRERGVREKEVEGERVREGRERKGCFTFTS